MGITGSLDPVMLVGALYMIIISILVRVGHFYFGLTHSSAIVDIILNQ